MVRQQQLGTELRGYVWAEYVLSQKGWTYEDFEGYQGTGPGKTTVWRWRTRSASPGKGWVRQMADDVPWSWELYHLPLWQLLKDEKLSIARIQSLMSGYCTGDELLPYRFPCNGLTTADRKPIVVYRDDSQGLVERGDIYGFMAIVALVREAEVLANRAQSTEADEENLTHLFHISNLYRALPALGKFDWLRPDFGLLCRAVRLLLARVDYSARHLGVNWDIVDGQFGCRYFEPCRERRPMDPLTRRFQEIADPVTGRWSDDNDIGDIPCWPPTDIRKKRSASDSEPLDNHLDEISEDEIQMSNSADLLFRRFRQITREWKLERYSWEPMLGIGTTDLDSWLEEYPDYLPRHAEIRVGALIALHAHVSGRNLSGESLQIFLDRPIREFEGESIRVALTRGFAVELYEHFRKLEVKN